MNAPAHSPRCPPHFRTHLPTLLSPHIAFAIFIISAQQQGKYSVYFYGSFLFVLQLGRLPEKLLAILIPFDRVESTIAHLVAAEQFGLLCDIDNARDGQAG